MPIQNGAKMIETLANGYSFQGTLWEILNEYQLDRVLMAFKDSCALYECSLSIRRVRKTQYQHFNIYLKYSLSYARN